MKAADWIDQVKKARGWDSDYRAAQGIGLTKQAVSKYRNGGTTLDEDAAVKVAVALGAEPEIIILDQAAERTKSTEARDAIRGALRRLSAAAVAVFAIGGSGLGTPSPASAQGNIPPVCIMSND